MTTEYKLLKVLSDGNLHSGQKIADQMGVSRTAVWKHLKKIRSKSLDVYTVRGKGYRLEGPLELLQEDLIAKKIRKEVSQYLHSVQVVYETDSTNNILLEQQDVQGRVIIAEYQHAGKGRGENIWLSGLASSLCLSIGWHYEAIPSNFNAISLATGVVLARCIEKFTGVTIQLKWPNDLIHHRSKLGGVLIESRGQHAGIVDVVVGIGINFRLPTPLRQMISQNVTDLSSLWGETLSRNDIAAEIINETVNLLSTFPERGFNHYIDEWRMRDSGKDCEASLYLPGKQINGRVVDIDENGNLIMSTNDSLIKFGSGELSLRLLN